MAPNKAYVVLREIEEASGGTFLPIIGPEKGQVLSDLLRKYKHKRVLEVGTLVGYSAILMGKNLSEEGTIICIEIGPALAKQARENIKKAGMQDRIEVLIGDAKAIIPSLSGLFDFLFLDAAKEEYLAYLKLAEDKLTPQAIVVADNAGIFALEMKDYLAYVRSDPKYKSQTLDFVSDAVEVSRRINST